MTSAFNGPVTNAATATLELQGNGTYSTATLTVANSFTNNGAIVLGVGDSTHGAIDMQGGSILTNAGTLNSELTGTGNTSNGPNGITGQVSNSGSIVLKRTLGRGGRVESIAFEHERSTSALLRRIRDASG